MSAIGDFVPFRLLTVFLLIRCLIVAAFMSTLSSMPCLLLHSTMITVSWPFCNRVAFCFAIACCVSKSLTASTVAASILALQSSELATIANAEYQSNIDGTIH